MYRSPQSVQFLDHVMEHVYHVARDIMLNPLCY